ncbi:MAG: sugar phosphate isomerase/epimerase [Armatimonadetes bacterium]|nr:sugar phosphate isomerase/epimerase [Armatimonadota bacterium]
MPLNWALNSATVKNLTWEEELPLWERFGWRAVEVWEDKLRAYLDAGHTPSAVVEQLDGLGIEPVGMCAGVIWTPSQGQDPAAERAELQRRLDLCAAIGCPSLTVIAIGQVGDDLAAEYEGLSDKLHAVAELASGFGVRLNLEFLGGEKINGTLGSCIDLVNVVDHPSLGVLFDISHYYCSASHFEEMGMLAPEKLFLVHIDDVRDEWVEGLTTSKRAFPGEGRADVPWFVGMLLDFGYTGWLSVELYDPDIWALPAEEVLTRLDESLKWVEEEVSAE